MLPISKERNLKANHNRIYEVRQTINVVTNIKRTKSESKSQRPFTSCMRRLSCYQYQKNEIWKQITTPYEKRMWKGELLPISKERNLKANHNASSSNKFSRCVVTNIKRTKSESKSQQTWPPGLTNFSCYQYQKNEIWKQITTRKA